MIKILDTILKIENDSKAIVADAQKKAREIKEKAEKENADRLNAVRTQAEASLVASMNKTKKEWEEKYQHVLSLQNTLYSDFLNAKSIEIDNTADKIMAIIKKPRHKSINE